MHRNPEPTQPRIRTVRGIGRPLQLVLALVVIVGALATASTSLGGPSRAVPPAPSVLPPATGRFATAAAVPRTSKLQETAAPAGTTTDVIPKPARPAPPLPACRFADEPADATAYDDWGRTVVDTIRRLPQRYVPPDLVPVSRASLAGGGSVRAVAIDDLRALARAARKAGAPLAVQSAYRSERRQRATFAGWVRSSGRDEALRFSARPGHSEHQLGTAIDFRAARGSAPWLGHFETSRQAEWLTANAWRFGWVLSYPEGAHDETCYDGEAWHYRYVGREAAAALHASGLTLRAWLLRAAGGD